jgi:hypothetical protein
MSSKFAGSDGEQVQFAEDFEELADLEEFLGVSGSVAPRGSCSRVIGCGF